QKTARREQSWLDRRRVLPEELAKQLRAGSQRGVYPCAALVVVQGIARISENISRPVRQARAGPVVRQQVPRDRVDAVCRNGEVWKRVAGAGVRPVAGRIVNDPSRSAKISGEHFSGGAVSRRGERRELPQPFVERMKPYTILAQRSPDRPTELVAL